MRKLESHHAADMFFHALGREQQVPQRSPVSLHVFQPHRSKLQPETGPKLV